MKELKTFEEINKRIAAGKAVVVSADQVLDLIDKKGIDNAFDEIDVVTTATFGPMCSSGAFLNFGHADPPIRMNKIFLNDVEAYGGLAAVDTYIGATQASETRFNDYGGAHVICDLVDGKPVKLKASSYGTDCYQRRSIDTYITLDDINEAYLFNPRNCYQNYAAAVNSSDKDLYTYMGILKAKYGNINYSTSGELSPLNNDPEYDTIGIGTRIFVGGTLGYVSWQGTQFNANQSRSENGTTIGPGGTLAVIGNLKEMSGQFLKPATYLGYGVSLFVGIGIPIPILNPEVLKRTAVTNAEIITNIFDYAVTSKNRPVVQQVNYKDLQSGQIELGDRSVSTVSLSSVKKAYEIIRVMNDWIRSGDMLLQRPIQSLPKQSTVKGLRDEVIL